MPIFKSSPLLYWTKRPGALFFFRSLVDEKKGSTKVENCYIITRLGTLAIVISWLRVKALFFLLVEHGLRQMFYLDENRFFFCFWPSTVKNFCKYQTSSNGAELSDWPRQRLSLSRPIRRLLIVAAQSQTVFSNQNLHKKKRNFFRIAFYSFFFLLRRFIQSLTKIWRQIKPG